MLKGRRTYCHLRRRKGLSQGDLAQHIGASREIIDRYERNEVKPSIEVATKMAEALQVSLDYLVGFADYELDHSLTQKILDIQQLNDEDKKDIMRTLDALLRDAKARKAYA